MRLRVVWRNGWAHLDGIGPDGKRVRSALKTQDARQAEEARAHLEARLWKEGIYGPEAVVTFEQAALAYAEDGGEARFLARVSEHFEGRILRTITGKDIREAAVTLYPSAKAATRNRQVVAPASAVINYGHDQGWCAPIRVKRFTEDRVARKAVGREYLDKLRPELPARLWALLLFLQTTGRRVGEAVDLRTTDCDWAARTALVRDTKNGEPIRVKLTKDAAEAMQAVATGDRAFGYLRTNRLRETVKRACARAGVEYLGTHQPGRHSFATHLKSLGWDSKAVADAGGWKSPAMVDGVYTHLTGASDRAADTFDKKESRRRGRRRIHAS